MITAEPEIDHHHLNHPSVKGAVTHYTDGEDESSHEVSSMFARAFEKVRFPLSTLPFSVHLTWMPVPLAYLLTANVPDLTIIPTLPFYRLKISFGLTRMGL